MSALCQWRGRGTRRLWGRFRSASHSLAILFRVVLLIAQRRRSHDVTSRRKKTSPRTIKRIGEMGGTKERRKRRSHEAMFLSHLLFCRLSIFPLIHRERTFYFSPRPRRSSLLWNTRPWERELPHHPLLATPSRVLFFSARHDRSVLQGSALRASTSVPDSQGRTDLRRPRRDQRRRLDVTSSEIWNFPAVTRTTLLPRILLTV